MTDVISASVAEVLSRNSVRLASPSSSQLTELYSTPSNTTSHLAATVQSYGRVRIPANNLNLNSSSTFTVSTSSLVSSMWLHVSLPGAATYKMAGDGWLFDAIADCLISFSNSAMQQMIIPGDSLRDYLLISAKDKEHREMLLKQAGQGAVAGVAVKACIPIGFVCFNAGFQDANFPVDFSALGGPMQVQITWKSGNQFTVNGANGSNYVQPTAWGECYLTAQTTDIVNSAFAIRQALAMDNQLVYSIPGRHLIQYTYNLQNVTVANEQFVQLTSFPTGMLQAILLNIRPQSNAADAADTSSGWFGSTLGTQLIHGESMPLSTLRLDYGGMSLADCRSPQEIKAMYMQAFAGDDLSYNIVYSDRCDGLDAESTTVDDLVRLTNVNVIPFAYNLRRCLSDHHDETLTNYGSASLSLRFTMAQPNVIREGAPFRTVADPHVVINGLSYVVSVTYILSAIVSVTSGTVDLIL